MKRNMIKLCAAMIAILIVLVSLPIISVSAAQPTTYSKDSNSGTRNEVCTTLSGTSASSYYTGSYTYENLSNQSASVLKSSLSTLMRSTHKTITTYSDCRDYVWQVDCENNNTSRATTLYTSHSMSSGEWAGTWSCNREHVWPQSQGGGNTSGGGADLHHIRPAEASVNSSRGNKPYGTSSGCYEPKDHVKGDVARICLYVHVRWGADWGASNINNVFQSVDILLDWCEIDPVDTWEMGRNEVVQKIQGNRNVFIDYPEFAWMIFGEEVPENMTTPSMNASNGNVGTGGSGTGGDSTGGDTDPSTPEIPTEIPESFVLINNSMYVTDVANPYTSSSGSVKKQCKLSSSKSEAAVMSLVENSDGTVSFKYGNKFLLADGTDVEFVGTQSDDTKFVLEQASGGYFVKCATATYGGKPQYLEVFRENLTCYGMGTDASMYTFVFEAAEGGSTNPDTPGVPDTPDVPDIPDIPDDPDVPDDPECTHATTKTVGAKAATCQEDGYSGDIYCAECNEKLEDGSVIAKGGSHQWCDWAPLTDTIEIRQCSACNQFESRVIGSGDTEADTDALPQETETEEQPKDTEADTQGGEDTKAEDTVPKETGSVEEVTGKETEAEAENGSTEKETAAETNAPSAETNASTNAPGSNSSAGANEGACGSSVMGSWMIISFAAVAVVGFARKKKED